MPTPPRSRHSSFARRRAFSLVEVTLALGIVTFALVGVVGVLPTALSAGRSSFEQNRAAAVAGTVFASLRSQPFASAGYLDEQFQADGVTPAAASGVARLDLNSSTQTDSAGTSSRTVTFYAAFLESGSAATVGGDAFGTQRRLCFTRDAPGAGSIFQVALTFNNHPDGALVAPPDPNPSDSPPAQANQVEVVVSPGARARDQFLRELGTPAGAAPARGQYRFTSTLANRP